MARIGVPISTALIPTCVDDIGPIVLPPGSSDLLTNFCTGTFAFLHIASYTETVLLSEVYF